MSCCSEALSRKSIFQRSEPKIQKIPKTPLVAPPSKTRIGGRGGGGGGWRADGCWYFQVYRRAMEGDLLALKPRLSGTCQLCSIVVKRRRCLLVLLLFPGRRRRATAGQGSPPSDWEPSALLLSDQTSPSHKLGRGGGGGGNVKRASKWSCPVPPLLERCVAAGCIPRSKVSVLARAVRRRCPATTRAPSAPPSARQGKNTTDEEAPSLRRVSPLSRSLSEAGRTALSPRTPASNWIQRPLSSVRNRRWGAVGNPCGWRSDRVQDEQLFPRGVRLLPRILWSGQFSRWRHRPTARASNSGGELPGELFEIKVGWKWKRDDEILICSSILFKLQEKGSFIIKHPFSSLQTENRNISAHLSPFKQTPSSSCL